MKDCQEAFEKGDTRNGDIYYLRPHESWNQTIRAVCEFDSSSGWTIFQRRLDGSVDFFRYWQDYVYGFGSLRGEYWIGERQKRCNMSLANWENIQLFFDRIILRCGSAHIPFHS